MTAAGVAALGANPLNRAKERLRLQDHSRPTAERHVVHHAMPIRRVHAEVVNAHVDDAAFDRASDDPFRERCLHHRRKDRDDVDLQLPFSFQLPAP